MRYLTLVALLACGSSPTPHTASWTLAGDLVGTRSADDTQGGRATCTAAVDDDGEQVLTLFFTTGDGAGLHVAFTGFDAAGSYSLGVDARGLALVYDLGDLLECGRSGKRCYAAPTGCNVTLTDWSLGETIPGARAGVAHGTLTCASLENDRHGRADVTAGRFTCRATDWR